MVARQTPSPSADRDDVAVTPTQRACAYFFLVVGLLFVIQIMVGAASEHYRADLSSFFGFDLARWLPYNLVRTWHVQLSIFWTATSFLATGLFLAPIDLWARAASAVVDGLRSPRGARGRRVRQHDRGASRHPRLAVTGSARVRDAGLGVPGPGTGVAGAAHPRPVLLGVHAVPRACAERLRGQSRFNLPWLFFFTGLAIPAFYAVGLLTSAESSYTVADFWRFMVVHLWVEDFLEIFTTVLVAYLFVMLGVIRQQVAMTIIYLDIILYSLGGVVGTMHHLYFSGTAAETMALGAFFSAAEVLPLTFLTVEAWSFLQLGSRQEQSSQTPFPHRWAVMFLVAVGFWNFLGAGIFGFLVNLPVVSYYEIGTALTANHAHAAMMGVYGMLAIGLALFCLRYLIPEERWPDRLAKISFWSLQHRPGLDVLRDTAARSASCSCTSPSTTATSPRASWSSSPTRATASSSGCACPATSCSSSAAPCRSCGSAGWGSATAVGNQVMVEPEDVLFTEIGEPVDCVADAGR